MTKTMTTILAALILALLAPGAIAKDPDKLLAKGVLAEKEGRVQDALEIYGIMVEEWPDRPKPALRLATCLAKAGKHEAALVWTGKVRARFPEDEAVAAATRELEHEIRQAIEQTRAKEMEEHLVEYELARIEAKLRDQGLRGDELREAYEREKARLHGRIAMKRGAASIERAKEALRELGLTDSELARRTHEMKELVAKQEKLRAEIEAMKRRADAMIESRRVEEERWRRERGRDLDAARREFRELAERLGIPGEAAERLLEEHRGRGPGNPAEVQREIEGVRAEVAEVRRHVEALIEKLNAAFAEVNRRLAETEKRRTRRVEQTEAKVQEVLKRLEALEKEVRKDR